MKESQLPQAHGKINDAGLHRFTASELGIFYADLSKAIQIGLTRITSPTSTDGGLLAFPTNINAVTQEAMDQVPAESAAITCACGGTNWIFTVARKKADGSVVLEEPFIRPIPENERQHTFVSLMELIAQEIIRAMKEYGLEALADIPIGISFGFPQTNIIMPNGDVDARLNKQNLPKFWKIVDLDESLLPQDQPSLSELLRVELKKRGVPSVGAIVFVNDTVAVALDMQTAADGVAALPMGFVFGTGTNGAMYGGPERGMVNLEAGHAHVIPKDSLLQIIDTHGWLPGHGVDLECFVGGGFLPSRLAAAVLYLQEYFSNAKQLADTIMNSRNQGIMSDIAQGKSRRKNELPVGPSEYKLLQECARLVLTQAGQLMGVMMAAVAHAAGFPDGGHARVPFEGSLLLKGYGVKDAADETARLLLNGGVIEPYKASGMVGVAKLAMVRSL
ncbi:MAG: hypothetical protein HYV32_02650 [Candidatus Kerfeldbacteria bacterium]|nr:hypothetical protein [Candidatus Kerfeldbacteria bacterium]